MVIHAQNIEEVQEHVRSSKRVRAVGGGSKTALSQGATICMRKLAGIVEYRSDEYIVTARSGTTIAEVEGVLAEKGQFLPFDPPLSQRGATLGGTVASGISGPGRWRYGGIRDFILSVQLVRGSGDVVCGGAKVVKNAAGFDIPKLVVGSLGSFGLLTEITFKVFPQPQDTITLKCKFRDLATAVEGLSTIATGPWELVALEFAPPHTLWIRMGGLREVLAEKVKRLSDSLPSNIVTECLTDEQTIWADAKEFTWMTPGSNVIKIPITPAAIIEIEEFLAAQPSFPARRYSCGGNVLYLGLPRGQDMNDPFWMSRPGVAVMGEPSGPYFGDRSQNLFLEQIRAVFDPDSKLAAPCVTPTK